MSDNYDGPPLDVYEAGAHGDDRAAVDQVHEPEPGQAVRTPTQDLEAEWAIIGAMMMAPSAIEAAEAAGLRSEDYLRPGHRVLHDAILAVRDSGREVDTLLTIAQLRRMSVEGHGTRKLVPALDYVGGPGEVMTMAERVPSIVNAKAYAEGVVDASTNRRLLDAGNRIGELAVDPTVSPDEGVRGMEQIMLEVVTRNGAQHEAGEVFDADASIDRWAERYERLQDAEEFEKETVSWGRPELDERLGRMGRGSVFVPAGWTKHGKTWFVLDVIEAVCRQGERVLLHSAEMSDDQVVDRWVAMGGFDYTKVQEKALPWSVIRDRVEQMRSWKRRVVQGKTTVARIRAQVSRAKLEGRPFRVVVIDHLGLVRPDRGAKFQPRREFVEDACAELQAMAEEYGFTLLLVCQLSRPERKPGDHPRFKRPPFEGDLKEASGIEQIATSVIFVHRVMDPETGKFNGQASQILFPFHRLRPTPRGLHAEFALPSQRPAGAVGSAYRFEPVTIERSEPSPAVTAAQEAVEGAFGPVTLEPSNDDIPF